MRNKMDDWKTILISNHHLVGCLVLWMSWKQKTTPVRPKSSSNNGTEHNNHHFSSVNRSTSHILLSWRHVCWVGCTQALFIS
ncbi:Os09g0424650 [Oryza sativa Japonica Group]|uniref:Os09g0424650 protein n=1 Tax=Oryza sativa subsp. japonica TaxID=39947 RepID=A0A0P0XMU1_ORYSJ|nr:hypothetical protein EE612_047926 [Oryza sativa]BAT08158.1 Os09g0424650 [Oryza sativa Japonica Group]